MPPPVELHPYKISAPQPTRANTLPRSSQLPLQPVNANTVPKQNDSKNKPSERAVSKSTEKVAKSVDKSVDKAMAKKVTNKKKKSTALSFLKSPVTLCFERMLGAGMYTVC